MFNKEDLILDALYELTMDELDRDLTVTENTGYLAMYDYCVANGIEINFAVNV